MSDPERAPRLEERWDIRGIDGRVRQIYVEPGCRGDETYLLEQMRSLAAGSMQFMTPIEVKWDPPVAR